MHLVDAASWLQRTAKPNLSAVIDCAEGRREKRCLQGDPAPTMSVARDQTDEMSRQHCQMLTSGRRIAATDNFSVSSMRAWAATSGSRITSM